MAKDKISGRVHIDVEKIDKGGIWQSTYKDNNGYEVTKKYLTLDIFVNNKEDKYGKDIYIHQSLGKVKDEDGNDVLDEETGKVKYGKVEFIGKGHTVEFKKKEKKVVNNNEYHEEKEDDSDNLPF